MGSSEGKRSVQKEEQTPPQGLGADETDVVGLLLHVELWRDDNVAVRLLIGHEVNGDDAL